MSYVGVWETKPRSPTYMYLAITSNGQVNYSRKDPNTSVSFNGPIKEWKGKNFIVAVLVAKTEFTVQKTPYRGGDGRTHMMVDGVDLVKISD
ncbi:MAG: hypothetical protein ACRCUT_08340 [Spirochaetota bacterium]